MLRTEAHDIGLIGDAFELVQVSWRKAIISAGDDVQKFIDWISARAPGCAFLIGGKEVALAIELETDREANSGGDDLAMLAIGGDLHDRPLFLLAVPGGLAGFLVGLH